MTEQPKLIESIEEALEAEKQGRLVHRSGDQIKMRSLVLGDAMDMVKMGLLSWKPEEWEYVTVESFSFREATEGKYSIKAGVNWMEFNPRAHWITNDVLEALEAKEIRRKKVDGGDEIELVEIENTSSGWTYFNELKDVALDLPHLKRTGRTFKGVIHE